jgi:hypothetical protein
MRSTRGGRRRASTTRRSPPRIVITIARSLVRPRAERTRLSNAGDGTAA